MVRYTKSLPQLVSKDIFTMSTGEAEHGLGDTSINMYMSKTQKDHL